MGAEQRLTVTGQQFANDFAFPNFYFHAAAAGGICDITAWKSASGIFSG